jgi:hypothetical protein
MGLHRMRTVNMTISCCSCGPLPCFLLVQWQVTDIVNPRIYRTGLFKAVEGYFTIIIAGHVYHIDMYCAAV